MTAMLSRRAPGGDPPVTVVSGVEQIELLVIFEEALRFATFSGP